MARKPKTEFTIVPAEQADLDRIMEIEHLCFSSPWSRQVFVEEMGHTYSKIMVARQGHGVPIAAFINYWIVHDEVHVLNVATHPGWRRRGLARLLMNHATDSGLARGARLVTLEVRRSNVAAIAMYTALGYRPVDIRRSYYSNGEDAIVMILDLQPRGGAAGRDPAA